jgi:hypothetical protein
MKSHFKTLYFLLQFTEHLLNNSGYDGALKGQLPKGQ